ncbi:MAG TPA: hypothetical protein VGF77_02220 [Allosphingosinicella sp.]|jgi:hypothetical protein
MKRSSSKSRPQTADQVDAVQQFIDELNEMPEGEHVLFGMVKPAEARDGLMFAHTGACGGWIYLPASSIASVARGEPAPCRGHYHVTATIRLKPPTTEGAETFAKVAALHLSRLHQFGGGKLLSDLVCGPHQHVVTDKYGNQRCVDDIPFGG